jgi:hypothetical protein
MRNGIQKILNRERELAYYFNRCGISGIFKSEDYSYASWRYKYLQDPTLRELINKARIKFNFPPDDGRLFTDSADWKALVAVYMQSKHQHQMIYIKKLREQIMNFYNQNFSEENHRTLSDHLFNLSIG